MTDGLGFDHTNFNYGLSISKKLIEMMSGKMEVQSEYGKGSVFSFSLPTRIHITEEELPFEKEIQKEETIPREQLKGIRVLLLEDNSINQQVAREFLENEGVLVQIAGNGQRAVEMLQDNPKAFDLILMDRQMPIMDGYEASREIRDSLNLQHLP